VLKPAGFENAQGIITAAYLKDPTDKKWTDDEEMKMWSAWMDKWMPGANKGDANYVYAYSVSFLMHQTLKNCGNELTRANVMKQAASFSKLRVPLLLPGITFRPAQPTSIRSSRSSSNVSRARPGSCSASSCQPRAAELKLRREKWKARRRARGRDHGFHRH
jgi:hypothetical protein